ncbi:MAG: hypothetical protein QGH45_11810 [Myxococcota bacterium]|jgi:hypothetical protein|nr:hypothetical protein [Myxococcota bacterium]
MVEDWPEYKRARHKTRRQFLMLGAGALGASVLAGGLVALPFLRRGPYPTGPVGLKRLGDLQAHVLAAVVGVVLGAQVDPGPIVERVDRTLDALDPTLSKGMLTAFPFLEGSGFLLGGRLRPFTELPIEAQHRVFDSWSASHVLVCRQATALLRELVIVHHHGAEIA